MQQDDRERDAAASAPGDSDGEERAEETGAGREPESAEAAAEREPETEETAEFENAPSANRPLESDQQAEGDGDETPPSGVAGPPSDEARVGPPPQEAEAYPASPAAEAEEASAAAHSVPATQVGESTQCPRCGTENRPGVAFCRSCGQRLVAAGVATTLERPGAPQGTQACPRCGTLNRAGVAFCQNCGANLRASAQPAPGYVPPPASAGAPPTATAPAREAPAGGAILGPLVLLVGAVGIATAWMLPFAYGDGSLWQRSFGATGGYGIAFWNGYAAVGGGILEKAYFGFAAAAPILVALLVLLVVAGFLRAAPGALQVGGLVVATIWAVGLIALFVVLEIAGNWSADLVSILRVISPAGIIFLLAGLIVLIGCATRFARS
ncbi:MAG: zinc ribbon domain-containing protein [Chloroflexi bacterium]|nr:MAG: zinc ribbon domain-containing protein [Chloroflexota bacterium]